MKQVDLNLILVLLQNKKIVLRLVITQIFLGIFIGIGLNVFSQIQSLSENSGNSAMFGKIVFNTEAIAQKIPLHLMQQKIMILSIIALLVVSCLWNLLKSYEFLNRYLIKAGVMLPLAVAISALRLNRTLWILCVFSTLTLLLTAVTVFSATANIESNLLPVLVRDIEVLRLVMWCIALVCGSCVIILISSIGNSLFFNMWYSEVYTHVLPLLSVICAIIWGLCFTVNLPYIENFRIFVSLIPISGFIPVVLAPAFNVDIGVLVVHALLSLMLVSYLSSIKNMKFYNSVPQY